MSKSTVTAADVREFYRGSEKRLARLSEAARKTVEKGARGRLHPEVVADHNKARRNAQYESGATNQAKAQAKAEAQAAREALRASGVEVGSRGPLPKVTQAQPKG